MRFIHPFMYVVYAALLAACGGGGGGNDSKDANSGATTTFPVEAALTTLYSTPHTFTVQHSDAITGTTTIVQEYTPLSGRSYDGMSANATRKTTAMRVNGIPHDSLTEVTYYHTDPLTLLATDVTFDSTLIGPDISETYDSRALLPQQAKVGDGGRLAGSELTLIGLDVTSRDVRYWDLQPDTASTAWLCLHRDLGDDTECFKINGSGAVLDYALIRPERDRLVTYLSGTTPNPPHRKDVSTNEQPPTSEPPAVPPAPYTPPTTTQPPAPTPEPTPQPAPDQTSFAATVDIVPPDGGSINYVTTLTIIGSGMQNVELLPANGYTPVYGRFTVYNDGTNAVLYLDTRQFPNGPMQFRIAAFDRPAGDPAAREIVAMPTRTWNIINPQ